MSRSTRVTEITVGVAAEAKGHFTAAAALNQAGITIPHAKYFEIDRRRLCEDNECYNSCIEDVDGVEHVHYEIVEGVIDPELLSVIITIHYD